MPDVRKPTIGRIVHYRSKTGRYFVPAIVAADVDTLDPRGVARGNLPPLTDELHAHLYVISPGAPYQERDVPYDRNGAPGTWRWHDDTPDEGPGDGNVPAPDPEPAGSPGAFETPDLETQLTDPEPVGTYA